MRTWGGERAFRARLDTSYFDFIVIFANVGVIFFFLKLVQMRQGHWPTL